MPIKNMWYTYKMECIEAFLDRAFEVRDKYTEILFPSEDNQDPAEATEAPQEILLEPSATEDESLLAPEDEEFDPYLESQAESDHALDILLGYQDIVFRAVYSELNALVELELKSLANTILQAEGEQPRKFHREKAREIISKHGIALEELPRFEEVDEVRKIMNAYKHDDGSSGTYEEAFVGAGELFGYVEARYKLSQEKAYQSIQAVKEFMRALPGARQEMPETRPKLEDAATLEARRRIWDYLRRSGAMGHDIDQPIPATDGRGGYTATCKLCGKSLWHGLEEVVPIIASIGPCPGAAELRRE